MHSPTALHVLTIVLAWLSLIPSISAGRISRWHRSKDWEDDDDCTSSTTTSETPCPETSSGWPYQTTAYSPTTTFTSGSASSSPASSVIPSCNVTVTTVTVTFEPTAPLTPTATSTCPPPNATVTVTDVTITATTITAACPTTSTSTAPPVPTTTTPPAVDYYKRNLATISAIYNLTVYPNQLPILFSGAGAVPPGLFAQNVIGRVAPVGDFRGFEDSIEYFFALAPVPQANAAMAAITHFKITEFTTGCPDLAASVVYLFCNVVDPTSPDHGKSLAPLKQVSAGYLFLRWSMGSDTRACISKFNAPSPEAVPAPAMLPKITPHHPPPTRPPMAATPRSQDGAEI